MAETNRVEIATEQQRVVFSRTGGVFVLTTCVRDGRQWRALFDAGRPLLEGPFFNLQPIHYAVLTDTPDRKAVEFSGRHRRPDYDWTMRVEVASDIPLLRFTITCHLSEPLTLDAPQPVVALWMRQIAVAYRLHEVAGDPKFLRYSRDFMNTLLRLTFWYEDETDPVSRELHNAGLFYPHCGAHVATPWETAEAHLMIAWTWKHDREHPVTDLLLKLSNLNAIDNFEETISGVERQFVAYNPGRTDRTFRLIFKHASRANYFATIGDGEQELGAADLARGVPLTLPPGEHIRITVRPGDYRERQLQIQQQRSAQNALSHAYQLMQDVAVGRGRETVSANNIETFKEAVSACREGRHADAYGKAKGIVDDIRATIHLTVAKKERLV